MRTPKEIAERFAEGALANFGRDGELAPAIIVLDREQKAVVQAIPILTPELYGMPGALYAIGNLLCPLFEGYYMVIISETWIHHASDQAEVHSIRRGELEERALGGDTTIHTGLLINVFDLDHLDDSHGLIYDVEDNFSRADVPGLSSGGEIAEAVTDMVAKLPAKRAIRPPGPPPLEVAQMCAEMLSDYVAALMVMQEEAFDE